MGQLLKEHHSDPLLVFLSCCAGRLSGDITYHNKSFVAITQALVSCLSRRSVLAEHRFCVNLLKTYGALSGILLISDLASFGAILGQVRGERGGAVTKILTEIAQKRKQ